MTSLEQQAAFDVAENECPEGEAKVAAMGNQSTQFTLPCGCSKVEHHFTGNFNPMTGKEYSPENFSKRRYFFTICSKHAII